MRKYLVHIIWFVIAAAALAGGIYYGKSSVTAGFAAARGSFASSTRAGFTGARGTGAAAGGGVVAGQILSLGSSSFTVQLANGNSQVIFYATSTSVVEPTPVSINKLAAGAMVTITGTQNSDGSLTAQSIQMRQATSSAAGQ